MAASHRQKGNDVVSIAMSNKPYTMAALLCAISALAGCTTSGSVQQPVTTELVSSEQALIIPPPGGPSVSGVIQKPHSNGIDQTVLLATSARVAGQNYFKVLYTGASGSGSDTSSAPYRPISESSITAELVRAMPGIPMARSNQVLQNGYGPFGYAAGKSPVGDNCIFAWQQIRSRGPSLSIGRDFGMVQVRMRLCDAHVNERQLLQVMYGYTLTGTFAGTVWNPFGTPAGVDEDIISGRKLIYPDQPGQPAQAAQATHIGEPVRVTGSIRPSAPKQAKPASSAVSAEPATQPSRPDVFIPVPVTSNAPTTQNQSVENKVIATPVRAAGALIPLPECAGNPSAAGC
jgi:hypothetical protein